MPLNLLDRWLAPAPAPGKVGWIATASFAHRGLHSPGLPENSLAAAAAAVQRGLGIECDVQRSSDGKAMVFHDWELDRLTGVKGPLASRSADQLVAITLSGSDEPIPTLRQLLDQMAGQTPLLIEVKSQPSHHIAALCLAVRRVLEGYRGPHAVMSFDPRVSHWFATHSPMTVRGLIISEQGDKAILGRFKRIFRLWQAKPDFLAYDIRDLPSRFAARQRKRGLPVATWTVNSQEHAERAQRHADAAIAEGAGVR